MRILLLGILLSLNFGIIQDSNAQFWKKKKNRKVEKKEISKEESKYDKLIKNADVKKGMFNVILKKRKLYIEIPKNLFSKDFLLASRISKTSNNSKSEGAGFMTANPILISFTADSTKLYVTKPLVKNRCDKDSPIYKAFRRNNLEPIRFAYKIETYNNDSTSVVADFTNLLLSSNIKELSPFGPFTSNSKLSFNKQNSRILGVKAFEDNVQINSLLSYNNDKGIMSVEMCRNIIKLPEDIMPMRFKDDRIGYFASIYKSYEANGEVKRKKFIHRWRIEPKKEDIEKYKAGQLVEPAKPIIWYVDPQIPSKYREYIKKGIEDWQLAFEEIGFKNAIIAKEYPSKEEDPNFDPDNVKYSCYRYIPSKIKNSMGPSWIDPRSGEILTGDCHFYSNVVELLKEWRFVQTAQLDKRVRSGKINSEVIGEALRNVAAHEIGHTLGLRHNMIASYNYPVDSLRSVSFTKKYGTTPSIMDYARYNYVAQPQDKGVCLAPPLLGIYDKFAIKIGYKYNAEVKTPEQDFKKVAKWLFEKKDNKIYTFLVEPHPLDFQSNPANNRESLGNDLIKASQYGIKNLKYINKNLTNWVLQNGEDYSTLEFYHAAIGKQFSMYLSHVFALIGGTLKTPTYVGYNMKETTFISKSEQRKALYFVLNQLKDFPNWWNTKEIEKHLGKTGYTYDWQVVILGALFNMRTAYSLMHNQSLDYKDCYTYDDYHHDVFNIIWESTLKNKKLSFTDKVFQSLYLKTFEQVRVKKIDYNKGKQSLVSKLNLTEDQEKAMSVFLNVPMLKSEDFTIIETMAEKTLKLLERVKNRGRGKDKEHYQALYYKVKRLLKD